MKKSNDWMVLVILFVVVVIVTVILIVVNLNKDKKEEVNGGTVTEQKNYKEEDGKKINTSVGVKETKTVGNFSIENSKLVVEKTGTDGYTAKVTAKVINKGAKVEEAYFKIHFYDNENKLMKTAETFTVFDASKTGTINSSLTFDTANAKKIEYELITTN